MNVTVTEALSPRDGSTWWVLQTDDPAMDARYMTWVQPYRTKTAALTVAACLIILHTTGTRLIPVRQPEYAQ